MSVETSNSESEQFEPTWTPGPWYTSGGFRHILATVPKNHPLQYWPDCDPDAEEGDRFFCDDPDCEFRDNMCKDEWENCGSIASIAICRNPEHMTQGDQVIGHPQIKANVDLITLAPDMAEAILYYAQDHEDRNGATGIAAHNMILAMADEIKTCGKRPF